MRNAQSITFYTLNPHTTLNKLAGAPGTGPAWQDAHDAGIARLARTASHGQVSTTRRGVLEAASSWCLTADHSAGFEPAMRQP